MSFITETKRFSYLGSTTILSFGEPGSLGHLHVEPKKVWTFFVCSMIDFCWTLYGNIRMIFNLQLADVFFSTLQRLKEGHI